MEVKLIMNWKIHLKVAAIILLCVSIIIGINIMPIWILLLLSLGSVYYFVYMAIRTKEGGKEI